MHNETNARTLTQIEYYSKTKIMRIKLLRVFFMISFISMTVFAQETELLLIHNKVNKVVTIKKNSSIVIKTIDGQKIKGELVAYNNSSLFLKDNKNSISEISIENIELLKKDLFNNKKWIEPFAATGVLAVVSLIVSPFVWIFDGKEKAQGYLELSGILATLSSPAIIVSLSKKNFNLEKDWRIEIREGHGTTMTAP